MSPRLSPHRPPAGVSNRIISALFLAIVAPITVGLDAQTQPAAIPGPTSVTVTNVNIKVVGTTLLSSSGRLAVAWSAPAGSPIDHYEIQAVESRAATTVAAPASATSATLSGLKASTTYSIVVKACRDAGCLEYGEAASVSGTTSAEYWQVQGTGASAATATLVVPNVMAWPLLYGAEAGNGLQGKVRLYYKYQPNVSVALSTGAASGDPTSVASFTTDANYGLANPSPGTTFINTDISAPQGVPRLTGGSPHIRLFFKAVGTDNKNRLFYVDSQDGLTGQDFHPGAATIRSDAADYAVGSAGGPINVLGVVGDATNGDTGLLQARQTKIGLPLLTNWLWDDAPGTFMVITGQDDCGQTVDGLFYGQWDGSRWNVTKDVNKCARPLVMYAHGPVLLHRGDTRFKLYYEDRVVNSANSNKPLRMIYGDGAFSGASSLEFEDWESQAAAREVHFLWPDGSLVAAADESGFGDHVIFYPTADPDVQVMYMNRTGLDGNPPQPSSGIGMAVLINP